MLIRRFADKFAAYPKTSAFILGWLSIYALPPFHFFPILFISFSGLFWLLRKTADTPRKAWKLGYFFGFGHFAFGLSWIGNALLLDISSLGWLYPLCLLAGGAFFGLFTAVPFWLSYRFSVLSAQILAFSGLWGLSEWLRSFILTGFPWNLLGSVFAFSDAMLQTASVWGTYGLSVITVLIASFPAIYLCFPQKRNLLPAIGLPILLFSILYGFGLFRLQNTDIPGKKTTIRFAPIPDNHPESARAASHSDKSMGDMCRETTATRIHHLRGLFQEVPNWSCTFYIASSSSVPVFTEKTMLSLPLYRRAEIPFISFFGKISRKNEFPDNNFFFMRPPCRKVRRGMLRPGREKKSVPSLSAAVSCRIQDKTHHNQGRGQLLR